MNLTLFVISTDFVEENTPEVLEAIRIEAEAVSAAELKHYEVAIATFQKSIDLAPLRAAPYNNRAQAYRLMGNDEGKCLGKMYSVLICYFIQKDIIIFIICKTFVRRQSLSLIHKTIF